MEIFPDDAYLAMFELTRSPVENTARYAAVAIGNLSVYGGNQRLIASLGGLPYLIDLLGSQFKRCQQFAARALYR